MPWRHTVWPEPQLVYTALPKVANTSIKVALIASFMPDVPARAPHSASVPYLQTSHLEIPRKYPGYLHFAVVRDPYSRVVSFWADKISGPQPMNDRLKRLGFDKAMTFAETLRRVADIDDAKADGHFRSQTFLLCRHPGELGVDLLLRFERLDADWELLRWIVAERNGAYLRRLPHRNPSRRRDVREYYDSELWALAAERYATDLDLLGYSSDFRRRNEGGDHVAAVDGPLRARLASRAAANVVDLTPATAERAAAVLAGGGRYLGLAAGSSVGQLVRVRAVARGRIAADAFDTLVVREVDCGWRTDHRRLRDEFRRTDRTVVAVPADETVAAGIARRARHTAGMIGGIARRQVGRGRRLVSRLRSAGTRRLTRFRAA